MTLENTEKLLVVWIEDLVQKKIPVHGQIIKEKALRLYKLVEEQPSTSLQETNKMTFLASDGWLTRLFKRHVFHNLKVKGEIASADENTAKSFPEKLSEIIKHNGCKIKYSMLMRREYSGKNAFQDIHSKIRKKTAAGFKAAKDRVTFLLCSNASGDKILKPLFINTSLKPRALKGKNIKHLLVHWMANKKAWMTADLFKKWFYECFVPEIRKYMEQKGLNFKVLLLCTQPSSNRSPKC